MYKAFCFVCFCLLHVHYIFLHIRTWIILKLTSSTENLIDVTLMSLETSSFGHSFQWHILYTVHVI